MKHCRMACGCWEVDCLPDDGARLACLRVAGHELLTPAPACFRPPAGDFGLYETRTVYGYDDCFPTVDPCRYPDGDVEVPDHGELCWLPWRVTRQADSLIASVDSRLLPVTFERVMRFDEHRLTWTFKVVNRGARRVWFEHVMHALMPRSGISGVVVPAFASAWDEAGGRELPVTTPGGVQAYLEAQPAGAACMVLLRELAEGRCVVRFAWGGELTVTFPRDMFPTLGIWWNRRGYPDEAGGRRDECAFEPIPGSSSSLAESFERGSCPHVPAGATRCWTVVWEASV